MEKVWLWVLAPMAINLTNGCAGLPGDPPPQIDVTEATVRDGSCFAGLHAGTLECHVLGVRIVNDSGDTVEPTADKWSATTGSGNLLRDPIVEDDAPLASGASRTIRIGFTSPPGTTLVSISWAGEASADIPVGA